MSDGESRHLSVLQGGTGDARQLTNNWLLQIHCYSCLVWLSRWSTGL